ncbi:MAG: hypothetical protein HQM16_09615 [Deltaproteobacteria bacterium]|nr:hypothetical protein [Deltaproteobacteria bacterium]
MTDLPINEEIKKLKKETRVYYFICMFLIMVTIFLIATNTNNMSKVDNKIIESQNALSQQQSELTESLMEATSSNAKTILEIKNKLDTVIGDKTP